MVLRIIRGLAKKKLIKILYIVYIFGMLTGLKRQGEDKFYTKKEIAEQCVDFVKETIDIDAEVDYVIEPSAGNGSFLDYLRQISKHHEFLDIQPENLEIKQQDFLKYHFLGRCVDDCRVHVIGNPPFGRQSTLARQFIKHACSFADTISFVLPKSFKKLSFQAVFR